MEESRVKKFKQYREKISSLDENEIINDNSENLIQKNDELDASEVYDSYTNQSEKKSVSSPRFNNDLLTRKIQKEKITYVFSTILSFLILISVVLLGVFAYVF